MVRQDSENCHLNLSLSAVYDCGISILAYFFDVSAVGSVKQKLSGKGCDKALQSDIMPCLFLAVLLG